MKRVLFFVAFFHALTLMGQQKARFLSLQEGLSSQQVLDVAHDNHGFIWIATELGLNRFSSNSFKQYYKSGKADGNSINSNEINTLFYDSDHLYIGTRSNGLNVLDLKTNKFSYYLHDPADQLSIATNDITDIIRGKNGKLWLSTYHQGVQLFDPIKKEFRHFNRKNIPAMPENSIWTLVEDKEGLLYIGHVSKGLSILNTTNRSVELLDVTSTKGILPDNEVKALFCDSRDNIWIGTRKGLAVYNPFTKQMRRIPLAAMARNGVEPFIYAVKEINGSIWVGAESSQLFILQPVYGIDRAIQQISVITPFYLDRGNNSSVQNIDRDEFGNVWLAIYSGGVAFLGHIKPFFSVFPSVDIRPGLGKLATVTGILHDRGNSLWLATAGDGILQLQPDGKVIRRTVQNSGLADNFLLSGFEDKHNNKWFGSPNRGVSFFNVKTRSWHKVDAGEKMSSVRAMIEDSQGNLWFAAQEGLFIHNPEKQTFQKLVINTPMLGDYSPRTLVEDSKGYIWVGTYGQGLYVFDRNRKLVGRFTRGQGIFSNTINHLFRDRSNNIWVATNEGLALQSANKELGKFERISIPGADAWLTINALAEDGNGNIWCSTRLGLLRYLPGEKRILSYDQAFGLPLGGFTNNSVAMDAKGKLFFGMPAGICYFEPTEIPLDLPQSPIRISRFMVFNTGETHAQSEKYPNLAEEICLEHDENSFRVELAVMDYALNDMVEFSYKLQGLDNDWIFLGNEKNLDFRSIPYGNYELRIRTRQKNEPWSGDYKHLFIKIAPPFYLSTLAIVFYVILVAAIVWTIFSFYVKKVNAEAELRMKKLQLEQDGQLHMERLNFYTNITHELRTPLTLILGPLDNLLHDEKLLKGHKDWVQIVQKNANRLFALVNQLLEFRKVESQYKPLVLGEAFLGELVQDTVLKYVEANHKKELTIKCIVAKEDIKTTFDAEIVQLILDNLLSNACKYTASGTVEVRLEYEKDRLSTCALIYVKDTGCGIAAEHLDKIFDKFYQVPRSTVHGTGVGLALVKELAAIHHGKIAVKSEPGKGTEFCVRLLTNTVLSEVQVSAAAKGSENHMTAAADHQRPLLLLVEDDSDLRDYLGSLLAAKYEVIQAENGQNGFTLAKSRIPDLILSDVSMPDMDGFRMLEALKQERETSHIPMIFLTARDTELDKERGYELGVDSYLTKPISPQLLYSRIENLLLKQKAVYAEVLGHLSSQKNQHAAGAVKTDPELWRENAFVKEFAGLVEACIQDEVLDVATLADKMNMSQSTLYRKLKGLTGKNINQLVRKVRIQKAAELLREGQYNITEVSLMVGINSSIYFRQCFKEEFGQLPSEYQKDALK